MDEIKLDIPAYDRAVSDLFGSVVDGYYALHPILKHLTVRNQSHEGPTRNVSSPVTVDHVPIEIGNSFPIANDVVRKSDLEAFTLLLYEVADDIITQVVRHFFQVLRDVTAATGNVVSAHGQPFTWDLFLDGLEKIELSFDSDGNPEFPMLAGDPQSAEKIARIVPTDEQLARFRQIVLVKKAAYDAQKRSRRLS